MTALRSILAGFLIAASLESAETETLGRLGDLQVSVEDVRAAFESLRPSQAASVRADPKLLEQVVRSFLVQKLVLKEATEKKWHEQPRIIAKIEQARASTITESYLESVSEPPADYPAEADLTTAYEKGKTTLRIPRSFRLAQIFIAASPKADQKLRALKERLAVKKSDFAEIASTHSEEPTSAARGGEIGWLTEAQIQQELLPQLTRLKLFAISEPVRLNDGWHVLKLLDSREPYTPTLEQVRAQLTQQLRSDKLRENSQAYLTGLLKQHPLTLNKAALAKGLPSTP